MITIRRLYLLPTPPYNHYHPNYLIKPPHGMRRIVPIVLTVLFFFSAQVYAQFTPGRIVVLQVGNGTETLVSSGNSLFLKEFTISGTAGTTVSIPNSGANALIISGAATSEGFITRSTDGSSILIPGYDTTIGGSTSLSGTTSATVPRGVGVVTTNGNYSLAVSANIFSKNNIRGVAGDGNSNYWMSGATTGTIYSAGGTSTTTVSTSTTNQRVIHIYNGQLYYSTGSGTVGIYAVGTGTPTTASQTGTIVFSANTNNASPYGFAFSPDGNTCYVSDEGSSPKGGIYKYVKTAGTWNGGTLIYGTSSRDLCVDFSTANPIIYATTNTASANALVSIIDNGGTGLSATTLATAPANTVFAGVCFSPGFVWKGNTSTDWSTYSNWVFGSVPNSSKAVVIIPTSSNNPIVNAAISIKKGIVNPGASIAVSSGNTLTIADTLTLQSTATASAIIGVTNGSISGNVTVERYIPAHAARAYTMVGFSAFGGTIYNNWQEGGAATVGYGTQISGSSTGNGFDFASAAGIASIYTYDDPDYPSGSKWQGLLNTNSTTPSSTNNGYLLFVRGDRTVGAGSGAPSATTLRSTGSVATGHVGPMAMFIGANVYSLVANPYACPINWSTTTKTNISGSFTVYDPNLLSFVTSDGTTVSPNISQQQANIIQAGQAFFTQNDGSGNTPGWEVNESDKNTGAATGTAYTVFGMNAPTAQLNMNIYKANNVFADGAVAVFNSSYAKNEDTKDAAKFTNFAETVSFAENNNRFLSIDARPLPNGADTLFIDMKQMVANATYSIVIDGKGFTDNNLQSATLVDKQTGTSTPLDLTATSNYSFTASAATQPGRLFIVLNAKPLAIVTPPVSDSNLIINSKLQVNLLGNPVKDKISLHYIANQAGNTTIRLMDANGQALNSLGLGVQQQGTVNIPVAQYAGGMYFVEVTVGGNKAMVKVIKE